MRVQTLKNGNIAILANNEERHELAERYRDAEQDGYANSGYKYAEEYIHEALHEILCSVRPECIGALTDAPIFAEAEGVTHEAVGGQTITGGVFWFPDYQIKDPYRELANCGRVVFTYGGMQA